MKLVHLSFLSSPFDDLRVRFPLFCHEMQRGADLPDVGLELSSERLLLLYVVIAEIYGEAISG